MYSYRAYKKICKEYKYITICTNKFVKIKLINMKKRNYTEVNHYVDFETGEVRSQTIQNSFYEEIRSEEHFFMTYIDMLAPWFNLKPESAKAVLM